MNYFLLPCCAYEFSGSKFQRRNSSVSAYKDFCDYVYHISNRCGFTTLTDRLKIPSTKRHAFIGIQRIYSRADHAAKLSEIKEFLSQEQQLHPIIANKTTSAEANSHTNEHNYDTDNVIKLREKHETVKNCTQIDKKVIDKLVKKIFMLLLNSKSSGDNNNTQADDKHDQNDKLQVNAVNAAAAAAATVTVCTLQEHTNWQQGGQLTMSDIAKQLDGSDLKSIKSECGGLKTLLRNKHEIFEFCFPGFIKIRKPQIWPLNLNKPQTIKKRLCFYKQHHPQGCPLADEECTFIH